VLSGNISSASAPAPPGRNVGVGKDDTLFATSNGVVVYETIREESQA
jgi:ribosomal protein L27